MNYWRGYADSHPFIFSLLNTTTEQQKGGLGMNDILEKVGFAGIVLSVVGIGYTIYENRKTKRILKTLDHYLRDHGYWD